MLAWSKFVPCPTWSCLDVFPGHCYCEVSGAVLVSKSARGCGVAVEILGHRCERISSCWATYHDVLVCSCLSSRSFMISVGSSLFSDLGCHDWGHAPWQQAALRHLLLELCSLLLCCHFEVPFLRIVFVSAYELITTFEVIEPHL